MLPEPIPASFLLRVTTLSLAELLWAFERGVIGAQTVVDVASEWVANGDESELARKLAEITHAELAEVKTLLAGANAEVEEDETRAKWTWLLLSWVHERHAGDDVAFSIIATLWEALGGPAEMEPFGPYAPDYQYKDTPESARAKVLAHLRSYLASGQQQYGRSESNRG